jgi:hypothetical protein
VGVAVDEREQANQGRRRRRRQPQAGRNGEAHGHHRDADALLDHRHRHAGIAEKAAHDHRAHERRRQQPQRARPELGGVEPDGDHRQHMVEAAQGVQEAVRPVMRQAVRRARPGMGERRCGKPADGQGSDDREHSVHSVSPC